jgi:predicted O-linked N-acetylglucosamine transferase (SPINDLY family)
MPSCHVEIVPHADYAAYMGMMEEADFAIDCYPFAGSNTVSDNLWLRKPVVCLEGDRWFNRIGSAMLRSVGLGELAIHDHGDFINLVSDMIRYEHVRNGFTDQLKAADLGATIYAKRGAAEFAEFIQERAEEVYHV